MNTNAPTPGHWEVLTIPTRNAWEAKRTFISAPTYEGHPYYGRTRYVDVGGEEDYPTRDADLRLMASSPQLLEALEDMQHVYHEDWAATPEYRRKLSARVTEAIKIAKGLP